MRKRQLILSTMVLSGLLTRATAANPPEVAPPAPAIKGPERPLTVPKSDDARTNIDRALRASPDVPEASTKAEEITGPTPPGLSLKALCIEAQPAGPSPEELELRKKIAAEREELVKERARVEKMQTDVAAARQALRAETARLEQIIKWAGSKEGAKASDLQSALANKTQLESLAKTMKELKPEKAADLFRRMPRPIGVELLRKMKPANVAAVLACLDPKTAAEVMETLAVNSPTKASAGGTQ